MKVDNHIYNIASTQQHHIYLRDDDSSQRRGRKNHSVYQEKMTTTTTHTKPVLLSSGGHHVVELSTDIFHGKVLPLLDRTSYNQLAVTCKYFHQILLQSSQPQNLPPWPGRLVSRISIGSIKSFSFAPSGTVIACGYSDGSARIWQLYTGEQKALQGHWPGEAVTSLVFGRTTDTLLATASNDHTILLWNLESHVASNSSTRMTISCSSDPLKIHAATVGCLKFSSDDKILMSGHNSSEMINFWNVSTGTLLRKFQCPMSKVASMEISSNGQFLLTEAHSDDSSTSSNCLRIWNLEKGTSQTLRGGSHTIFAQSRIKDEGFHVASVNHSDPSRCHVWKVHGHDKERFAHSPSLQEANLKKICIPNVYPYEIAFSEDGSKISSVDDFRSIKIWRLVDGKHLSTFHEQNVLSIRSLAFCPKTHTVGAIVRTTRSGAISRTQNVLGLLQMVHEEHDLLANDDWSSSRDNGLAGG